MSLSSHMAPFRRVVVGFRDGCGSATGLEAAVRFAQLFESELLGIFIEDMELTEWSGTRKLRQLTASCSTASQISQEHLLQEFAAAAEVARQRLLRIAGRRGLTAQFRVERSRAAALDLEDATPGDLLTVLEPADPLARLSYPFTGVLRAITETSAPVLYLPHLVRWRRGPVIAVMKDTEEDDLQAAAELAGKLDEELILLGMEGLADALRALEASLLLFDREILRDKEPSQFASLAAESMVPALITGQHEKK